MIPMLRTHIDIRSWLIDHEIDNYRLSIDGYSTDNSSGHVYPEYVVDIDGHANIDDWRLIELPIRFRQVAGSFCVYKSASLESFYGFPSIIQGDLRMHNTQIKSLKGIEKQVRSVDGTITIRNDTTHLLGLVLITGVHRVFASATVGGNGNDNNRLNDILEKHLNSGDILSFQDELIDAGFVDQARAVSHQTKYSMMPASVGETRHTHDHLPYITSTRFAATRNMKRQSMPT